MMDGWHTETLLSQKYESMMLPSISNFTHKHICKKVFYTTISFYQKYVEFFLVFLVSLQYLSSSMQLLYLRVLGFQVDPHSLSQVPTLIQCAGVLLWPTKLSLISAGSELLFYKRNAVVKNLNSTQYHHLLGPTYRISALTIVGCL